MENYPPGCIIGDPAWHAPKLWRAALWFARHAPATRGRGVALPLEDWHDGVGPCLWWTTPVTEPPYAGDPRDTDWPGYHTHFTPLPPAPVVFVDPMAGPTPPRPFVTWAVVDAAGRLERATDETDARSMAAARNNTRAYGAPHRAVRLRETPADA
jgi:hypothetical protein